MSTLNPLAQPNAGLLKSWRSARTLAAWALAACAGLSVQAQAQAPERVLNLYSARHYQTDEALYENFTKATGIRIQRVEADDAGILARLKAEGNASPADVILRLTPPGCGVVNKTGSSSR